MIESYVDLTYRGVSLGRRIKLSQVRPSSGYLELPTPMPVGTQVAIATDDGVTFDATVTWIYEQVAGADRVPGMVVAPRLTDDVVSAWWTARVALPDEDPARVTRTRPVTARPRSQSKPVPVPPEPGIDRSSTLLADLNARVTAAAGLAPRPPGDGAGSVTAVINPVDPARPEPHSPAPELEPVMRRTGEHDVIDDGYETMIMESVDPAAIGLDGGTDPGVSADAATTDDAAATIPLAASDTAALAGAAQGDPPGHAAPGDAAVGDAAAPGEAAAPGDVAGPGASAASDAATGDDAAADSGDGPGDESAASDASDRPASEDKPPPRRGWFRRRSKRP